MLSFNFLPFLSVRIFLCAQNPCYTAVPCINLSLLCLRPLLCYPIPSSKACPSSGDIDVDIDIDVHRHRYRHRYLNALLTTAFHWKATVCVVMCQYKIFPVLYGKEGGNLPFFLGFIYFDLSGGQTAISMKLTEFYFKPSEDEFANTSGFSVTGTDITLTLLPPILLQDECLHRLQLCFGSSWSSFEWYLKIL